MSLEAVGKELAAARYESERLSSALARESRRVTKWQLVAIGALFVGAAVGALFGGLRL